MQRKPKTKNQHRAFRGRTALETSAYGLDSGLWDYESSLRDLLTDIIHFVGLNEFNQAVETAKGHHEAEKDGE